MYCDIGMKTIVVHHKIESFKCDEIKLYDILGTAHLKKYMIIYNENAFIIQINLLCTTFCCNIICDMQCNRSFP